MVMILTVVLIKKYDDDDNEFDDYDMTKIIILQVVPAKTILRFS